MSLYKRMEGPAQPLNLEDYQSKFSDQVKATWAVSFDQGLGMSLERNKLEEELNAADTTKKLTADEAVKMVQDSNIPVSLSTLGGIKDGDYTTASMDRYIREYKENLVHYGIIGDSNGLTRSSALFGVGLAAIMSDPYEFAASTLVPAKGIASTLRAGKTIVVANSMAKTVAAMGVKGYIKKVAQKAKGLNDTAFLARLKAGAIDGAVGNTLVEPWVYQAQNYNPFNQYTLMDSATNIALGAIMGAGIKGSVGLMADGITGHFSKKKGAAIERFKPHADLFSSHDALILSAFSDTPIARRVVGSVSRVTGSIKALPDDVRAVRINELGDAARVAERISDIKESKVSKEHADNLLKPIKESVSPEAYRLAEYMERTDSQPKISRVIQEYMDGIESVKTADIGGAKQGSVRIKNDAILAEAIKRADDAPEPAIDKFDRAEFDTKEDLFRTALMQVAQDKKLDLNAVIGSDPNINTHTAQNVIDAVNEYNKNNMPSGFSKAAMDEFRSKIDIEPDNIKEKVVYEEKGLNDAITRHAETQAAYELGIRYATGEDRPLTSIEDIDTAARESFGDATGQLMEAGRVKVVDDVGDLPYGPHPAKTKAMTLPDGSVFIVAKNTAPSEIKGIILHEVGIHAGLENMVGSKVFADILDNIDDAVMRSEVWAQEARVRIPDDTPMRAIKEETLAYIVENHPDLPVSQKVISAVRAWFYKNFALSRSVMNLTDADLSYMAAAALRSHARRSSIGKKGGVLYSSTGKENFKAFREAAFKVINEDLDLEKARREKIRDDLFREFDEYETINDKPLDQSRLDFDSDDYDALFGELLNNRIDEATGEVAGDIKTVRDLEDRGSYMQAYEAAKAYLGKAGVEYKEVGTGSTRYLEITRDGVEESVKLRFSDHENQSAFHSKTEHNFVELDSGNDFETMMGAAIDFQRGVDGVGEISHYSVGEDVRTFSQRIADGEVDINNAKALGQALIAEAKKGGSADELFSVLKARLDEIDSQTLRDASSELTRRIDEAYTSSDALGTVDEIRQKIADDYANDMEYAAIHRQKVEYLNEAKMLENKQHLEEFIQPIYESKEGRRRDNKKVKLLLEGFKSVIYGSNLSRVGSLNSIDAKAKWFSEEQKAGFLSDLQDKGVDKVLFEGKYDKEIFEAAVAIGEKEDISRFSQEVLLVAESIIKLNENMRVAQNAQGANIEKLNDHVIPQTHNAIKLRQIGFDAWKEDVLRLSNMQRTFTERGVNDTDRSLRSMYDALAEGWHEKSGVDKVAAQSFGAGRSIARKVSEGRLIHFKDGLAQYEYSQKYGHADLAFSLVSSIEHSSKNIALMERLGTNPEYAFTQLMKWQQDEIRGETNVARKFQNSKQYLLDGFKHVDGSINRVGHETVALVGSIVRDIQNMSKLGLVVLSSVSDVSITAAERSFRTGENIVSSSIKSIFQTIDRSSPAEREALLTQLSYSNESIFGLITSKWASKELPMGYMTKGVFNFFKFSAMQGWVENMRRTQVINHAYDLGVFTKYEFNELSKSTKSMLKAYNIDAKRWELIKLAALPEVDGRRMVTPKAAKSIPDKAIANYLKENGREVNQRTIMRERERVENDIGSMSFDRMTIASSEPNARTRHNMFRGTERGTAVGEVVRTGLQFKSFPFSIFQRSFNREIYSRGYDTLGDFIVHGKSDWHNLASFIAANTVFGLLSVTAKDLIKGKEQRDLSEMDTWIAALTQGGGLGIYGDFLFGEFNRFGGGLTSTLVGPTFGMADDLARIFSKIKSIEDDDDALNAASTAFNVALSNTPYMNLHMVRPIMDYLIIYRIKELLDPGYLDKMERRAIGRGQPYKDWKLEMAGG